MKATSQKPLLNWWERVSIFDGPLNNPETHRYLLQRAQREVEHLRLSRPPASVVFEYRGELIRGRFVDAIEGDYPGTYMIVLQIASSRVCAGPCHVRLRGHFVDGIIISGQDGIVGITLKVTGGKHVGPLVVLPDLAAA